MHKIVSDDSLMHTVCTEGFVSLKGCKDASEDIRKHPSKSMVISMVQKVLVHNAVASRPSRRKSPIKVDEKKKNLTSEERGMEGKQQQREGARMSRNVAEGTECQLMMVIRLACLFLYRFVFNESDIMLLWRNTHLFYRHTSKRLLTHGRPTQTRSSLSLSPMCPVHAHPVCAPSECVGF